MKILSFEAENVKRLRAVTLTLKDGLMVIAGKNGQGKSSCLDAIAMALGGKALVCDRPLRTGETKGHVTVTLGEPEPKYKVTRRFGLKGTTSLIIEAADGTRPPSPQALLDGLLGSLSFDPLAFSRMEPKRQADTLRALVGLDTTQIDGDIAAMLQDRTQTGRSVTQLEGSYRSMAYHGDAPTEEVSISGVAQELEDALGLDSKREELESVEREHAISAAAAERRVHELEQRIIDLQEELATAKKEQREKECLEKSARERAKQIQVPDIDAIRERLKNAEAVNEKVRENKRRADRLVALETTRKEYDDLTKKIDAAREERRRMIEALEFPIEGLALEEGSVLYNGLPFDQASQAEQLRVSVAMGLALNPTLKLLLIRDGSLLDGSNVEAIAKMAQEAGAQILMERVEVDAQTSVVISDGMVVHSNLGGEAPDGQ